MFLRSGWSVVRSALLAKGGASKNRLSLHLRKVLTWSNKASPRTFQTALVLELWSSLLVSVCAWCRQSCWENYVPIYVKKFCFVFQYEVFVFIVQWLLHC